MPRLLGRSLAALTLAAALGLAGCTGGSPSTGPDTSGDGGSAPSADAPSTPATASSPAGELSPTPAASAAGEAAQRLPLFSQTVASVWTGPDPVSGRAYIDALVSAGFDKAAMQVTADQSTIGNAAESIEFSVRLGDECLVGQVGPSIGDPVTAVLPGLSSGGCLIGQTRAIDW
ncbi:hypothetical protein HR12_35870 [Microbacterium sp. SUBG005]|nr:hypothetical protein HR12_35870 [Microbacterium sp. SUBG005]